MAQRRADDIIPCIEKVLRSSTLSEKEKQVWRTLRDWLVTQWLPHLDEIAESQKRLDETVSKTNALHGAFMIKRIGEDKSLLEQLEDTSVRVNIYLDTTCWIAKRLVPATAGIIGLALLIREVVKWLYG